MMLMPFATAVFTGALRVHAATTDTLPALPPPKDTSHWGQCATVKVSGAVIDAAHKGIAGVWVQDGIVKPVGARTKTDKMGTFTLAADTTHQIIFVFGDSSSTEAAQKISSYGKERLYIKKCVAIPITIIVQK